MGLGWGLCRGLRDSGGDSVVGLGACGLCGEILLQVTQKLCMPFVFNQFAGMGSDEDGYILFHAE